MKKWKIIASIITFVLLLFLCIGIRSITVQREQKSQELNALKIQQNAAEEESYNNLIASYQEVSATFNSYLPGIVCWGDSLTAGAGGDGTTYPLVLDQRIREDICDTLNYSEMIKKWQKQLAHETDYTVSVPVINMGVGGENTNTILGRNGAIPFLVSEDFVIPASKEPVSITLISSNGKGVAPLRQGNRGMESVTINGIQGIISIEQETYISSEYQYFFTRKDAGDQETIKAGTWIITSGSENYLDYIPVIFIGQNGGYDTIDELISSQRAIINHQQQNKDRFIIVGLHTGTADERAELENAMKSEYGRQYINLREYMSTRALEDAGLEPTDEDKQSMALGMTPASLLIADGVHFNAIAYKLIGGLIYDRMEELKYFYEVKSVEEISL